MKDNYEIVEFKNGEFRLDVSVTPESDTVWLSANQMSLLFSRDVKTIRKHINNVLKEEVDVESNTQKMRVANSDKPVLFYSLDVIISVGYRVKSKEGIIFRKWANNILKQYMLKGYVVDAQRYNIPSIERITKIFEGSRQL